MLRRVALVAVFMSICTLQATGEVLLGPPQVFPHPIVPVMNEPGHKMPESGYLSVAPNQKQVAVIRRFECDLYELDQENDRWLGPYAGNIGGVMGSRANPDRSNLGTPERLAKSRMPLYGWTVMPDGSQVFVVSPYFKRAVKLAGGVVDTIPSPPPIVVNRFDPITGRTTLASPEKYDEELLRYKNLYARMKAKNAMGRGAATSGGSTNLQVPDEVNGGFTPSPDGIHILCLIGEQNSRLVCLNTATGERVRFPIQNGRPRTLPGGAGATFSPDGKYILMEYNYGPHDHYDGGYLQLFTREGQFLMEIAEYYHGLSTPTGYSDWLSNGWLVYSNGRELVFQKITFTE